MVGRKLGELDGTRTYPGHSAKDKAAAATAKS
jgi:ribosomal protein S19